MNDDIDPAQPLAHRGGERGAALRRGQVGGDEHRLGERVRPGSRCRQDLRAEFAKQSDGGRARAARAGGDECALAFEREERGHAPDVQTRDLVTLEPEREGERGRTARELAGHLGADICNIVLLGYLERLDDVLVLGLRFAPPRIDGLVTGIGLALILDDGIGREGAGSEPRRRCLASASK